jgi:protein gp37
MSDNSAIEWTDATWNPIRARNLKTGKLGWHCEHTTTGCEFCYAEGFNKRLGTGLAFKPGHRKDIEIFLCEETLLQPLRWKRPRVIFPGSMTDLFADFVRDEWLHRIFAVVALTPHHTYQPLTKRASRMRDYLLACGAKLGHQSEIRDQIRTIVAEDTIERCRAITRVSGARGHGWEPLPNVWLGVSTERQQEADERIPLLLQTPAAVRFVSAEPLLGPIDLNQFHGPDTPKVGHTLTDIGAMTLIEGLDWVICGGESGPKARPMHPGWARSLQQQCNAAGVKFFFKQWGRWAPVCALNDQAIDKLYKPAPVRDPDATRQCLVPQMVMHADGTSFTDVTAPNAFAAGSGAMQMFAIGKKKAGRRLDGVEYSGMPPLVRVGAAA